MYYLLYLVIAISIIILIYLIDFIPKEISK